MNPTDLHYFLVNFESGETLVGGGPLAPDPDDADYAWLTSAKGDQKVLRVPRAIIREITPQQAETVLQAEAIKLGHAPDLTLFSNAGEVAKFAQAAPKQFPAFPEPTSKPWNN